jgi:hypothetical protein
VSHLQNSWLLTGQPAVRGNGGDGAVGAVGGSGRRSTVEDGIRLQQYYEDLLLAPKYWKVEKADEEEFEDSIIKFKTDKKGELLVKVKHADGSSNGWYEGSVNTAGLVQFNSGVAAPWTGNVNGDGGHLGFNVSYGDGNVGALIAGGVW